MKLLLIRHGEPDYENDTITAKGVIEANHLADKIKTMHIDECYVSPLGRARATAAPSLKVLNKDEIILDWLREFSYKVPRPDAGGEMKVPWDWLPTDWTKNPIFYDKDNWMNYPLFVEYGIDVKAKEVIKEFDLFLKNHGYERENEYYRAVKPSNDTVAFFCHFGLGCILMGHLIGASPMVLWHGLCAAPTSITTIATEERRKGYASFRTLSYGDVSHLYAADEAPSFAARFCECYGNEGERID